MGTKTHGRFGDPFAMQHTFHRYNCRHFPGGTSRSPVDVSGVVLGIFLFLGGANTGGSFWTTVASDLKRVGFRAEVVLITAYFEAIPAW